MNDKLLKIKEIYNELKNQDCHINSYDSDYIIRRKDMLYGQIIAYEKVIEILEN